MKGNIDLYYMYFISNQYLITESNIIDYENKIKLKFSKMTNEGEKILFCLKELLKTFKDLNKISRKNQKLFDK